MIQDALHATVQNFAFGLVIGCAVSLLAWALSEHHRRQERRHNEAWLDIERRARERGQP